MEFILKFNSKTSSPNRVEAIKISERNIKQEQDNICEVKFSEVNEDFIKLLGLVSGWSTTQLFMDGVEVKSSEVNSLFSCYKSGGDYGCEKGKKVYSCNRIRFPIESYGFPRDLASLKKTIKEVEVDDFRAERFKKDFEIEEQKFIIKKSDSEYEVDKDYLKENIKETIKEKFLFLCPYFKEETIMQFIDDLPYTFKLKSKEEEKQKEEVDKKEHTLQDLKDYEEQLRREKEIRLKIYEEELKKMKEIKQKVMKDTGEDEI